MALKTKYSPLQHFSVENLFIAFSELSSSRRLIALGVVGGLLLLVLFLPLSLFSRKVDSLRKEITQIQKGYRQVVDKIVEYEQVKESSLALEESFGRPASSLTSRIEGVAKQQSLSVDQLREKAPQETDYLEINSIEAKLSNVSLPQLMEFLHSVENDKSAPMRVRKIQIKPNARNRQMLDISFEVALLSVKKEI